MEFQHVSVLLEETIEGLNIRPDGIYVDGTAGGAGHSSQIAKRLSFEQGGRLIAIDKDPDAIQTATQRLAPYPAAQVVDGDFKDIPQILQRLGIPKVDGILLDLGVGQFLPEGGADPYFARVRRRKICRAHRLRNRAGKGRKADRNYLRAGGAD